jgi:hypothetical protein
MSRGDLDLDRVVVDGRSSSLPLRYRRFLVTETTRWRWLAWGSGLACLLARLPFVAHRMWDHDSVQFALGVEHYDLAAHHPHPPGYPLYIALLKVLAACGIGPEQGMVAVTLVASALGAVCMPLLVRELLASDIADEGAVFAASAFAAVLYVFDPLLWFYGELPLLYAVEGGLTVVLAWTAATMVRGRWATVRAVVVLALAGGLRPSSLALLAPLVAFGWLRAWRRRAVTLGSTVVAAAIGGAVVLAWALPLFALAGGYRAWKAIGDEHFRTLLPVTSVLYGAGVGALRHNTLLVVKWAVQGTLAVLIVLAGLVAIEPRRWREGWRALGSPFLDRSGFLLAWALPAIAFFALFHVTKAGYTLVHLPALLVGCALFASPWLGDRRRGGWAAGTAAALGALIYLAAPARIEGEPAWQVPWRHEFHGAAVRAFDREVDALRAVLAREDPARTVLVTIEREGNGEGGSAGFLYSWHRHLQWYEPAFEVVSLVPDEGFALVARGHVPFVRTGREVMVPAAARRLVFVLAAPPDAATALPAGEALFDGEHFHVRAAALPADGRAAGFRFVPTRVGETLSSPSS